MLRTTRKSRVGEEHSKLKRAGSNAARKGGEWAREDHRLSAAGHGVSEIAKELRLSVRVVARVRRDLARTKSFRAGGARSRWFIPDRPRQATAKGERVALAATVSPALRGRYECRLRRSRTR